MNKFMNKLVLILHGIFSIPFVTCNTPQVLTVSQTKYKPNWSSLDQRPLPSWYDDSKVGIFLHWGVFSVPSFQSEWFWADWKTGNQDCIDFIKNNYEPNFTYQEFATDFKAEFFNPKSWAELFKKSGAKYVVLTSKHHEGYTMWPSAYSFSWNSKDVGPHRDLIGELGEAVREAGLEFGLYHSLYEWYNPLYLNDKRNNFTTNEFVTKKMIPEMKELVLAYKPSVLWSDGDWEAEYTYFQSTKFLSWLYNDSPVKDKIVVNDRWGKNIPCNHGGFFTCTDRYNPGVLQPHKWENAMTLDKISWGYRRNAALEDYMTTRELLKTMAETISCGGNILINVGPTKDGIIAPIFQERLLDLGKWLDINGEAIYGSEPWDHQNDTLTSDVWYTKNGTSIYAIVIGWPKDNKLTLGSLKPDLFEGNKSLVNMLGVEEALLVNSVNNKTQITFPDKAIVPVDNAWVLKITEP